MPQIHVDPAELEHFARSLVQYNRDLTEITAKLKGQYDHLLITWKDEQQQRFGEEFQQTLRAFNQFLIAVEEHVPQLIRKVEKLREYQKGR